MEDTIERNYDRVVILGLDGVPCSLLKEYVAQGLMPCFGSMMEEGSLHRMTSSLPEVSSVAWTSFMTGRNPGEHGIFGFMELKEGSYAFSFPNYSDVKTPPFWEAAGLPAVVLNIPQTYPARPFNGVMTSGFVAPDLKKATFPDRAYDYLSSIGYRSDVNANLARENPAAFFEDLRLTFAKRREAVRYFYENEDWRIFIGCITETDRLHHFFYHDALNGEGRYHAEFVGFYRELDSFLGEMYERAKKVGALFLTCSDHGFTPITSEVYLNQWLIDEGYLSLDDRAKGLGSIGAASRVFCLDPSRLYLHRSGVYPKGCVSEADCSGLRAELAQKLSSLSFERMPVVKAVYFRENIFSGDNAGSGPDLYVLPNHGFDLKGAVAKTAVFGTSHFKGMHTHDDAHFYSSEKRRDRVFGIEELAGLVTASLRN